VARSPGLAGRVTRDSALAQSPNTLVRPYTWGNHRRKCPIPASQRITTVTNT